MEPKSVGLENDVPFQLGVFRFQPLILRVVQFSDFFFVGLYFSFSWSCKAKG